VGDLVWPATIKPIVTDSYGMSTGSNIWRADVQGGIPRQGRDQYFEAVPIKVALRLNALERQVVKSFITNIDNGASSFWMDHDTGLGIVPHQVLITTKIDENTTDGINWIMTFEVTAERTAIQESNCLTQNLPDLFGCYGRELNKFLYEYAKYNSTYPFVNNLPDPS
jgi:hypothetical protein